MKKILSILIVLVSFAGITDAQISIKKSDVGKPIQMTTLSMSWSWIYQQDNSYFLVMKSDNQFDNWYWLKIGNTKEACLESITALQEMMDTMEESDRYDVDNGEGETFYVTSTTDLGIKKLIFHGHNYAGAGYLIAPNLTKATKWIEKNMD